MTVKNLTDLNGLSDKNVEELQAIGITNVAELKEAINGVLATLTVDDFNAMMDEAISVQPLAQ